jgi:hypothetical protein
MSRGIQPLEPIFSLTPKGLKDLHTLAQGKLPGTYTPIVQDHRKPYPRLRVTSSVHFGGILWTERLSAMGRLAALRDRGSLSLMFGRSKRLCSSTGLQLNAGATSCRNTRRQASMEL